jgi:OHCU decarboxylase
MQFATFLSALDESAARAALTNCCAAGRWVEQMLVGRHFANDASIYNASEEAFSALAEADWLEAFAAHPHIGDVESLRKKYAATKQLAAGEQAGVANADEALLAELAARNREYHAKFGFIFIVFATGKSAAEMLAILKSRIGNSRDEEIKNAAGEQRKITQLRLEKLALAGKGS